MSENNKELKEIVQDGQFELVEEVNARQTHKNLVDAVKTGNVDAVKAALESGANTSYDEPKVLNSKDFDMSNVAQDYAINKALLKGFKGDVIMGDIHGLPPISESQMTMLLLHELGHIQDKDVARNRVSLKTIEEKTGLTLEEALKRPEGQGMTESYKAAAKEIIDALGLTFVEPAAASEQIDRSKVVNLLLDAGANDIVDFEGMRPDAKAALDAHRALREKFNSTDKKDKNTPK